MTFDDALHEAAELKTLAESLVGEIANAETVEVIVDYKASIDSALDIASEIYKRLKHLNTTKIKIDPA